ncbi:MAG: zinc-binding alcohol dehydrogenase [Paracoccaceae bacterium]
MKSSPSAATENRAPGLVYVAPGRAEIRDVPLGEGECLLEMRVSALSRGTERLVFEGRVPESEHERMRAPFQRGDFPFPVEHGYCAVAEVLEGPPELVGRLVFALHPHRTRFRLPASACLPLPEGLPPERAALAANMETALNAVWDAGLAPGDRVAVVGAGLLGCLVARLAARLPGASVFLTDGNASRKAAAHHLGANFREPGALPDDCDVALNASASSSGLAAALASLGPEGRCVELSWHGDRPVTLPLGGAFHSRRLSIVSSQVGSLPPVRAPRWSHRRRLETALALLAEDPTLDDLIDVEVPFADLPARLPELLAPDAPGVATIVRYA